jgi:hypothetical protein
MTGGMGTGIASDFSDLRSMLKLFPNTIFIGHFLAFWQSFSTGIMEALLNENLNLKVDLSGNAAFKIMSSNIDHAVSLFTNYNQQFLFGTDRLSDLHEPIPSILEFMRKLKADQLLPEYAFQAIMVNNFLQLK